MRTPTLQITVTKSPHGWNYIAIRDGKRVVSHRAKGGRLATNVINAIKEWRAAK